MQPWRCFPPISYCGMHVGGWHRVDRISQVQALCAKRVFFHQTHPFYNQRPEQEGYRTCKRIGILGQHFAGMPYLTRYGVCRIPIVIQLDNPISFLFLNNGGERFKRIVQLLASFRLSDFVVISISLLVLWNLIAGRRRTVARILSHSTSIPALFVGLE